MIIDFNYAFKTYPDNILNFKGIWNYECPICHSRHRFHRHGSYSRFLILPYDGSFQEEQMEILRLKCTSCNHTHAILPADVIPYCIYSVSAVIKVCRFCLAEHQPVSGMASISGICYQMIYVMLRLLSFYLDWISLLLRNLNLWVSAWMPSAAETLPFLDASFFEQFAISFRIPVFLKRRSTDTYPLHFGIQNQNLILPT